MNNEAFLTVNETAILLGNSVQHVRLLARTGRLKANKVGRDWIVDGEAVSELRTQRASPPLFRINKRGRPKSASAIPKTMRESGHEAYLPLAPSLPKESVFEASNMQTTVEEEEAAAPFANDVQLPLQGITRVVATPKPPGTGAQPDPRNRLNELTATEWLPETVSVWIQRGLGAAHPDAQIERQHPAPFSFTDVARLIRFFSKRNNVVLDPFVGIGSTLKACALSERHGIGIELNPRYVELTRERLQHELPGNGLPDHGQRIVQGDAREILPQLHENSVDFVVTSPPYGSILHKEDHKARQERIANGLDTRYGDDPRDLGNIRSYEEFLVELAKIFGECCRVLKPKKYMAIIVSDYRHGPKYVMFHADLARQLETYNLNLHGITILYQRHKRVFPYGYPFSFVPNIHHQLILILQNGKQ